MTKKSKSYWWLALASTTVAIIASLLAFSLKYITEFFQEHIFHLAKEINALWFIILPSLGITTIYFLRKYLFKNRKNKGITEIYKTLDLRKEHLPLFKIPSHYINGFLTVIFGGSTGIEVSTVVASAAIGNTAYKRNLAAHKYKSELITAAVTAGVSVLFGSPFVGWLFSMEVIARKVNRNLVFSNTISALIAWFFILNLEQHSLLPLAAQNWHWRAIPFMLILSLLSGLLSVYITSLVLFVKQKFNLIHDNFIRVNLGALLVGGAIFFWPYLYGDSYAGLNTIIENATSSTETVSFGLLLVLVLLKPIMASLTLGAGGDGGVFAPSIVVGAFLGVLLSLFCNYYWGTSLIVLNFAIIGAAATLSASIYAPFTALFLACNLAPNGFTLFIPILVACWIARLLAQKILPYNVYTYDLYLQKVK